MAIRQRRGLKEEFVPSKLLPGEVAVATDTGNAWYCYAAGKVALIATSADIAILRSENAAYQEEQALITERIQSAVNSNSASIVTNEKSIMYNQKDISDLKSALASTNRNLDNVKGEVLGQIDAELENMKNDMTTLQIVVDEKVDGAYVEDGYLYMISNDEIVAGPLGPFSGTGGGGGSGGNNAILTVSNTSGWLSKSIASGAECEICFTWTSLEGDLPTGDGTLKVTINGLAKMTKDVSQGDTSVEVSKYLSAGSNRIKVSVTDVYGNSRSINYSVSVVEVSLASTFDASIPYTGAIPYTYVPTGNVEKTMHFVLDGNEIGTESTSSSGRQQTYTIPAQSHGSHVFLVYFTADAGGSTVESNHLYYELICVETGNSAPIITSDYNKTVEGQYTSIAIPYFVYNPESMTADILLTANDVHVAALTVDRTKQTWTYRADKIGNLELAITCGEISKTFSLTVTESNMDIGAETQDLSLHLSSYGRSNNEENPGTWSYGDIQAVFTGFNFSSDGWQLDADNNTVLRVAGDARLVIPYKAFEQDFRTRGKTIELEFATKDVMDYDTVILSCISGGKGIEITAQKAILKSEQSEIGTQYKEEEHVRISFVVEKRAENRLVYCYINGIMSGTVQYPQDDDFSQAAPLGISVGSNDCTIDLYCVRVYENDLTRFQVLDNWIADTQNVDDMLSRYNHNHVFDAYGQIVIPQLPKDLPYLVLEGAELPQYKGDKKIVSGYYVDPLHPDRNFRFENAQIDVQGTSSQYYARKNYKIKFKGGFILTDGTTVKVYKIREDAIGTSTFTYKADVASSEGANNVELVGIYNDACPYKTPPQVNNPNIRQGIDGFPIVIFWYNGTSTEFLGKYNFNNDKGTPEVYGFAEGDESWEVLNNTSDRVLFKSADYSGDAWKNDFEARYPEEYAESTRLSTLAEWLVSTDQEKATGAALPEPVTFGGTTYTTDTAEYRLAKFKTEFTEHIELDSALFYYLFTELFLMVDSRAKNMFPTVFTGGEANE
ncbi:hypothetical protein [Hespellia stercorisuis]|uniref:Uncharacterized protein n=1 Tax=Hespellia stercorisuis DSM 15480 TaxID=1121950 RepID=A0A1M6RLK4_9FIRM|nr:hypothetical protein [Hespellia stercorisuis]SHK33335.1 hypothetical protein SAMN02745243_02726 [Hespellia stercorisuis DSM 15480]